MVIIIGIGYNEMDDEKKEIHEELKNVAAIPIDKKHVIELFQGQLCYNIFPDYTVIFLIS